MTGMCFIIIRVHFISLKALNDANGLLFPIEMENSGAREAGSHQGLDGRADGQPPEHAGHPWPLRDVALRRQDDRHCQEDHQVLPLLRPGLHQVRHSLHRQKQETRILSNHQRGLGRYLIGFLPISEP